MPARGPLWLHTIRESRQFILLKNLQLTMFLDTMESQLYLIIIL